MQSYDFPRKFSFYCQNTNCHKIFISDQILQKLKYVVDEDQFLFESFLMHEQKTHKKNYKNEHFLEAFVQRYCDCLHGISSILYNYKLKKKKFVLKHIIIRQDCYNCSNLFTFSKVYLQYAIVYQRVVPRQGQPSS